jgi:hypothetical protein
MNERYLVDREGPPDPEIAALEAELAVFRARSWSPPAEPRRFRWGRVAAAAALLLLGVGLAIRTAGRRGGPAPVEPPHYLLRLAAGSARLGTAQGGAVELGPGASVPLRPGDRVSTAEDGRIEILAEGIARILVEPGSRIALLAHEPELHRFELEHGRLRAFVLPPPQVAPRTFRIRTEAGEAIDLGCEYGLEVLAPGHVRISVTLGAVAFQVDEDEVLVPRDHDLEIEPGLRPALPFASSARPAFREAVAGYVLGRIQAAGRIKGEPPAVEDLLRLAGPGDALTLLHLLPAVREADRRPVARAILGRVSSPERFDEERLAALDEEIRIRLRRALAGF